MLGTLNLKKKYGDLENSYSYSSTCIKHLYVRDRKDFFDKFVKLLDWENGTKETKESGQC